MERSQEERETGKGCQETANHASHTPPAPLARTELGMAIILQLSPPFAVVHCTMQWAAVKTQSGAIAAPPHVKSASAVYWSRRYRAAAVMFGDKDRQGYRGSMCQAFRFRINILQAGWLPGFTLSPLIMGSGPDSPPFCMRWTGGPVCNLLNYRVDTANCQ